MALTFRTTDGSRWGAGKGSNLSATEVDLNFWELLQLIQALPDLPDLVEISNITASGSQMTIHLSDGSTRVVTMPTATFRYRGNWAAATAYTKLDLVRVLDAIDDADNGLYLITVNHTSAATFDPARTISGNLVYNLVIPLLSGADGTSFAVDASGTFAERDAFDGEADGFSYLSTDGDGGAITSAVIFIRQGTVGVWSDAIPFQGPAGADGADGADGATGPQGEQGIGVPEIQSGDEDKILRVVGGIAAWDAESSGTLPEPATADEGKILRVVGGVATWDDETAITFQKRALKVVATDTYTCVIGDEEKYLRFTHASGCAVTVPRGVFAAGDEIPMRAVSGQVILGASGDADPHHPADVLPHSRAALSTVHLYFISTNDYDLTGDLELV